MTTNRFIVEIIHYIYNMVFACMALSFYFKVLNPKSSFSHPKKSCYIITLVYVFITNFYVTQYTIEATYVFYGFLLFVSIIFFNDSLFARISVYAFIFVINLFAESFAISIFSIINLFFPEKDLSPRALALNGDVIPTMLCHMFLFLCFYFISQFIGRMIEKYFQFIDKKSLFFLSVPFLAIFIHQNFFLIIPLSEAHISTIIMWAIMFVFLLYGLKRLEYLEFERLEKENHKNQLLQQAGHYEALYRKTLEQRRLAHDLSNHLSTINYMIDHNQFESCPDYINTLIEDTIYIYKNETSLTEEKKWPSIL